MIDFQSISTYLQIKIAEKMDYLAQKEFQLASKHGKDIANNTKNKAALEMDLTAFETNVHVCNHFLSRYWSQIRNIRDLPRFNVTKLCICSGFSPANFTEIDEKAGFVKSGVLLKWECAPISTELFLKLTEIFNVRRLYTTYSIDLRLFNTPKFQEIESINIRPNEIPDDLLLQLKSEYIVLGYKNCPNRVLITANLIFLQWLQKRRNIKWFTIYARGGLLSIAKEILFFGVQFSIVREYEEEQGPLKYWIRIVDAEVIGKHTWDKRTLGIGDIIFSIDRGDRKLLVLASIKKKNILALEYDDLREVFYVDENTSTSIEDEDDDLFRFFELNVDN